MKVLNDQELIEFSIWGKSPAFKRYAINELISRKSQLLLKYEKLFLSDPNTALTCKIRANYLNLTKNLQQEDLKNLSPNDFPLVDRFIREVLKGKSIYHNVDIAKSLESLKINGNITSYIMKALGVDNLIDFAFEENYLTKRKSNNPVVLVGMTKVKNEGHLANLAINHWLDYCDHIIVSDGSDDEMRVSGFSKNDVTIINQVNSVKPFSMYMMYDQLYDACRKYGATHIMHFDVDEVFSNSTTPQKIREFCKKLEKGEALSVPWSQLVNIDGEIRKMSYDRAFGETSFSKLVPWYKDIIYCDDGIASHRKMHIHCPYIPKEFPLRRFYVSGELYHLEGLCIRNLFLKYNRFYYNDYLLNKNVEMCFSRYLPYLYRNTSVFSDKLCTEKVLEPAKYFEKFLPEFKFKGEHLSKYDYESLQFGPSYNDEVSKRMFEKVQVFDYMINL